VHKPPWKIKDLQACFGRGAASTHKNCGNGVLVGRPSRTPNTERTNEKLCAHKDRRTLDGAVLLPIRSAVRQRVSMTCRRLPRQLAVESQLPKGANLSSRPVEVGQLANVKDCSAAFGASRGQRMYSCCLAPSRHLGLVAREVLNVGCMGYSGHRVASTRMARRD
jgi:hypothetical protein